MRDDLPVIWSEGMFIAPQHFQQSDHAIRAYVNALAGLDTARGDHGFGTLELNHDLLALGRVGVRAASGVFADRSHFRLDGEIAVEIPEGCVDRLVLLALPLRLRGNPECGEAGEAVRLVRVARSLDDTNEPENEPIEAHLGQSGARLMVEGADLSGYTTLPVARVLERDGDGRVVLDRGFVPPALRIGASPVLLDRLHEITALARVRAENAAARLRTSQSRQSDTSLMVEQFELLVLNRWLAHLHRAEAHPVATARALHDDFAALSAEMAVLHAETPDPDLVFDVQNPTRAFETVTGRLRRQLTIDRAPSVLSFDWNDELFDSRRLLRLALPPRVLSDGHRPILEIASDSGADLAALVPRACKIAPLRAIPDLVARGLPGVPIRHLPTAPAELRNRAGAAFFAIETASPVWQQIIAGREPLAMHVDDRIASLSAVLFMLK